MSACALFIIGMTSRRRSAAGGDAAAAQPAAAAAARQSPKTRAGHVERARRLDVADDDRRQLARREALGVQRASSCSRVRRLDDLDRALRAAAVGMLVAGTAAPSALRRREPPDCPRPGGSP